MLRETLPFSPLSARYRPTVYHLRPPDYSILTKLSTIQVYRHPHVSFTFQYQISILQTLTHRMTPHTFVHTRTSQIFLGRGGREEKDSSIFVRYVTAGGRMATEAAAHRQIYRLAGEISTCTSTVPGSTCTVPSSTGAVPSTECGTGCKVHYF